MIGKETIDINTFSKTTGHNGSYTTNYQQTGRELFTPDEVRILDNKYALLFIRGERVIKDLKYDILKHPNLSLTTDGNGKPYIHGGTDKSIATIEIKTRINKEKKNTNKPKESRYIIMNEKELKEHFMGGNEDGRKKQEQLN